MSLNLGFAGHFAMTAQKVIIDENGNQIPTGESRHVADFENLILDNGLNRIGINVAIESCCVGSGNDVPTNTQVNLSSIVGVTNTIQNSSYGKSRFDIAPNYISYSRTFRFSAGQAVGNLSEVGIGWGGNVTAKSIAGLWSRALIKDSQGNPTTVTILPDEILDVTYTVQMIIPDNDVVGKIKVSNVTYNYIIRPINISAWDASLIGYNTGRLLYWHNSGLICYASGDLAAKSATTLTATAGSGSGKKQWRDYVSGSYQQVVDLFFDLDSHSAASSVTSIKLIHFYAVGCQWQICLTRESDGSAIPKDATKTLKIPFVLSWGCANVA